MCEWGNIELINGINIDKCIVSIVKGLHHANLKTIASCCGHGKQPGSVVLDDGREILIFSEYEDARMVCNLFPPIN